MAPEIRRRVFERFFTTKPQGRGTGLGLATAHRFAVEHGGCITVESEEGNGTTVTVYLPCSERTKAPKSAAPEFGIPRGEETILVVDDDAGVRRAATIVLERHGYRVLCAGSAAEALELASREPVIHLLVTDVVLPRTDGPASGSAHTGGLAGGPALASALARVKPGVQVLFMSGHTDGVLEAYGIDETADLLQKGFLPAELACAVRRALNRA
jgi:CheY-like chemotaxis protein